MSKKNRGAAPHILSLPACAPPRVGAKWLAAVVLDSHNRAHSHAHTQRTQTHTYIHIERGTLSISPTQLLDSGADFEAQTDTGERPLHMAILRMEVNILLTLIDVGADRYDVGKRARARQKREARESARGGRDNRDGRSSESCPSGQVGFLSGTIFPLFLGPRV